MELNNPILIKYIEDEQCYKAVAFTCDTHKVYLESYGVSRQEALDGIEKEILIGFEMDLQEIYSLRHSDCSLKELSPESKEKVKLFDDTIKEFLKNNE